MDIANQPAAQSAIETLGIQRVGSDDRHHVRVVDNLTMWLSANLVVSTITVGTLAVPLFKMGFWDSFLAIVLFTVLGVFPCAFFSTLGPKLGLRQMTITRFSFGWIGASIMALLNVAACLGWSVVVVIIGAQLFSQITHAPIVVGILIIAGLTTVISIYGYKYVHSYERIAWMPMALMFGIIAVAAAPHFHLAPAPVLSMAEFASFVSFGGAVFGSAIGWASYASDYNVHQPENTPAKRVFWLTFAGIALPCIVLETFGVVLATAFQADSTGGLLAVAAAPLGKFGLILLSLLALSVVSNNVPNDYSLSLSMQVVGRKFQDVNRVVWTVLGAITYVCIAIPASTRFYRTMENFLFVMGYWLGPWAAILLIEHIVIRKGRYPAEDWDTPSRLPKGWAAMAAILAGALGAYLGADQEAFVGPLAKRFNVDIGFELGILLAAATYLVLRPIERRREAPSP